MIKTQFYKKAIPLVLVLFIDGMGLSLIFPILVSLILNTHSNVFPSIAHYNPDIIYGALIGIYFFFWFFGSVLISEWSDSIGRKKALLICLAGTAFGYLVSALAVITHTIFLLFLGRMVDGFTTGSQPIAQASIIDVSDKENKTRNLGYILAAHSLGFVLGPIVGGYLSDPNLVTWFSPKLPLYFAAVLSLINIILLLFLFQDSRTANKGKSKNFSVLSSFKLIAGAFKDPAIQFLSIIYVVYQIAWSNFFNFIPVYLRTSLNFSVINVGNFFFFIGLGFVIGSIGIVGYSSKHLGLRMSSYISMILLSIFTIILLNTDHLAWIFLCATLISILAMIAYVGILNLYSNQVDSDSQGRIMGITEALKAVVFCLVGIISGLIADYNDMAPLIITIIFMFLGAFLMSLFKSTSRPKENS